MKAVRDGELPASVFAEAFLKIIRERHRSLSVKLETASGEEMLRTQGAAQEARRVEGEILDLIKKLEKQYDES